MSLQISQRRIEFRLLQWFLFAVCLGISSIVLRWSLATVANKPISLEKLLADGELFIVAVALAGAALSDIVEARAHHAVRQSATFVAVVCVMLGGALYSLPQNGALVPAANVRTASIILFAAAALAGGSAVILKE